MTTSTVPALCITRSTVTDASSFASGCQMLSPPAIRSAAPSVSLTSPIWHVSGIHPLLPISTPPITLPATTPPSTPPTTPSRPSFRPAPLPPPTPSTTAATARRGSPSAKEDANSRSARLWTIEFREDDRKGSKIVDYCAFRTVPEVLYQYQSHSTVVVHNFATPSVIFSWDWTKQ